MTDIVAETSTSTAPSASAGTKARKASIFTFNEAAMSKLRGYSALAINGALDQLKERLDVDGGISAAYRDHRKRYLALNIVMNEKYAAGELGAISPVLRPQPTVSAMREISGPASDFLNDQRLLDAHYFWCCGHRNCSHEDGHKALSGERFNFEAAFRFARYGGATEQILVALGLSEHAGARFYRFGALRLRTATDKKALNRILERIPAVASQLAAARTSNNAHPAAWSDRYAAGQVLVALGARVRGPELKEASSLLFGHQDLPRPDVLLRQYRTACKHLGNPSLPQ